MPAPREDITEALWSTGVSSGAVLRLNQKIYRHIEAWRNRAIEGEFRTYISMEWCSSAAGRARFVMFRCWLRSALAWTDFGTSWGWELSSILVYEV